MMSARLKFAVVPVVLSALVLTGCSGGTSSGGQGGAGGTLSVNAGGFPDSWAPGAEMEAGYMRVPYENLVALDGKTGEITPVLATEWEQTDTALTLTLREGVTFHDGSPFDAEAVKVNLESVRDTPGPYAGPLKAITSIDVVDATTVRLNFAEPTPSMLTTLSSRVAPMASPAAIKDKSVVKNPVGTGPWAYNPASSTAGTTMTFKRYAQYWGGADAVAYDAIRFYGLADENAAAGALASGQIDVTIAQPEQIGQLEGTAGVKTVSYPAIRNNVMFFDRGPGGMFADVRVRQAACYAMDESVTGKQVSAEPRTQHFAENEAGYNPDIDGYPHDLAKAKALMAEAGNPTKSGTVLAAPFTETENQVYADQMSDIGVKISVQVVPPPQFFSQWNSGKYPIGLASNDELTPFDWYRAWFAADAPGNPSGVESPELKAAADKAIAAGQSDEAKALWADVTKIIADEALTCSHLAGVEVIAYQSNKVDGVGVPSQPWETNMINYRDLRPASGA